MRPCRLCCESISSCVYASKASHYSNVSHTCCGSTLFGKYYCCPSRIQNVSFTCKGTTGKCQAVRETAEDTSWMLPILCVLFISLMFLKGEDGRDTRQTDSERPILVDNDTHDDGDIDADWG
jgi:hypothetical protein